jgi:hypothetical protein
MNKLATTVGLTATLLAVVVAAHAAPSDPTPTPKLRPGVVSPGPVAALTLKAEALPSNTKCGDRIKQSVSLTNKTAKEWKGTVGFVIGTRSDNTPNVTVPAGETKTIDLPVGYLDCAKALESYKVQAWNGEAAGNPFFAKTMKPVTVKAEQGWSQPTNASPWLRRVWLDGKCGTTITGKMGLHATSLVPQSARVKLTLGAATKEETVPVSSSNAFVTVESPLDCQAPTGIPTFEFTLLDGSNATSGSLKGMIGYEPSL